MAIAAIHDWLKGNGPYSRGVELLNQFGKPTATQRFVLDRAENPHGRKVLTALLKEIYDKGINAQVQEVARITTRTPVSEVEQTALARANGDDPVKDVPMEILPEKLRPLRRTLTQMHTTKTFMRGQLSITPDGWQLRKLSLEIIELHQKMQAGWFIIETWRATGTILEEDAPKQVRDDALLVRELMNLRTNITKYEKGTRKPNPEKLQAMYARRDEISRTLDGAVQHT